MCLVCTVEWEDEGMGVEVVSLELSIRGELCTGLVG